ncbi:MAG: Hsp20/alpha crystallin family protein [Terriglobales bacterium]
MKAIPLELSETSDALKIKAFLAGYDAQDIEIHVKPQLLFISVHREESSERKAGTIIHSQPGSERVFRCLDLPTRIDPEKIRATLCNGELEIELAKAGEEQKLAGAAMAA